MNTLDVVFSFSRKESWAYMLRSDLKGFKMSGKSKALVFSCLIFAFLSFSGQLFGDEQLDRSRYISVDEVKPGMDAYCRTVYKGVEIEKFELEVISVVRNFRPGRDVILVQGKDERFIHTGPVAGCSGSPVYIDGRLAGALALGWSFSKDPLYGVTPIEEMLQVGKAGSSKNIEQQSGFSFDFSRPINFTEITARLNAGIMPGVEHQDNMKANYLPCPLVINGLGHGVCSQLNSMVEPFGMVAVAGIGSGSASTGDSTDKRNVKLEPGSVISIPIVTGDISMEAIGTVTEVVGDKVYGFGHQFVGFGPVEFPMATGEVHAVVSSVASSFKLGRGIDIVGAITADESAAIYGQLGAKARMIPFTIRVDRYNDAEKRVYNCRIVDNRVFTPRIIGLAVRGAALMLGNLPPDNTVEYKVNIELAGFETVRFENISTDTDMADIMKEIAGTVMLLMDNPYRRVRIKSFEFDIRLLPESVISRIWSVGISDSVVKAGDKLEVRAAVESVLSGKREYKYQLKVPETLPPGRYKLIVCGSKNYQEFLMRAVPYRFLAQNIDSLIKAVKDILAIKRGRLYCLFVLSTDGIILEKSELPDLPATKALVLADAKRALKIQPYQHWLEKSFDIGAVVIDEKVMEITVEK